MSKIKETDENIRAVKISTKNIRCENPIIEMLDEVYEELGKQFQDEEKCSTSSNISADEKAPLQDLTNPLINAGKARKYKTHVVEYNGKSHNIYELDDSNENYDMFGSDSDELSSFDDANDAPEPGPGLNEEEGQIKRKKKQLQHKKGDAKKKFSEDNESVHSNMSLEENSPAQLEGLPVKLEKNVASVSDPGMKEENNEEPTDDQSKCKTEVSKEGKDAVAARSKLEANVDVENKTKA